MLPAPCVPGAILTLADGINDAGHVDSGEIAAGVEEAVVAWGEIGGLCRRVAGERGRTEHDCGFRGKSPANPR
jgi:hypothetical protein